MTPDEQAAVIAESVDLRNPDWRGDLQRDLVRALLGVRIDRLPDDHPAALAAAVMDGDRDHTPSLAPSLALPVKGRCPNCGHLTLVLGAGGRVACSASDCDDHDMVDDLLGFAHRRGNEVRIARAEVQVGPAPCPCCLGDPLTVCAACGKHACWAGRFMCDGAATAGTKQAGTETAT